MSLLYQEILYMVFKCNKLSRFCIKLYVICGNGTNLDQIYEMFNQMQLNEWALI